MRDEEVRKRCKKVNEGDEEKEIKRELKRERWERERKIKRRTN